MRKTRSEMQEKPLTIAAYAAGASLTAAALVYVFGPTYFLDDEAANPSRSTRKKGIVGLSNPANDCFINSVLQALAGLPELRMYLIRELHRRKLDGPSLYEDIDAAVEEEQKKDGKPLPDWKLLGLQKGLITAGLKEVLDALNERPIYKKTISAQGFIRVVEEAFKTRVSRYQQDAQEFLQIVTERLGDEYHAGKKVRGQARKKHAVAANDSSQLSLDHTKTPDELDRSEETIKPEDRADDTATGAPVDAVAKQAAEQLLEPDSSATNAQTDAAEDDEDDDEDDETEAYTFPFEGKIESQVECTHCHFMPKASPSSFVTMTLNVPNDTNSTTLNACFDGMLKVEHIDDYRCDRCRLEHALQATARQLTKTSLTAEQRSKLESDHAKIQQAIVDDPEKPPEGVELPDTSAAPKRRIARHMRIASFPRVLAIHLSRSVWDHTSSSSKNTAKVSFPERLPLGGLLDRRTYRLLSVVTHKGGHNSGHYETFRRQWLNAPYSTPNNMGREGIFSHQASPVPSPQMSAAPSPRLGAKASRDRMPSSLRLDTPSSSSSSLHASTERRRAPTSVPFDAIPTPGLPTPPLERRKSDDQQPRRNQSVISTFSRAADKAAETITRKRKPQDRWWRISDDKIKESKTSDVLGMQKEVYLLFYELVENGND
jgi:ubiquitin carboxyl-terminal hydrolase 16